MTTEREKFEEWFKTKTKNRTKPCYSDKQPDEDIAYAAWQARQAEIDALRAELEQRISSEKEGWRYSDELEQERKRLSDELEVAKSKLAAYALQPVFESLDVKNIKSELEQVKAHNVMLAGAIDYMNNCSAGNIDIGHEKLASALKATSEQIESYKQELIAKAKEEQQEKDADLCDSLSDKFFDVYDGKQNKEDRANPHFEGKAHGAIDCATAIRNNKE